MLQIRWETKRRYYAARVYQDLLGDWVVASVWGGINTRLGNGQTQVVASYPEAIGVLVRINKERHARHYGIVASR